jgi:hypothetical protein
MRSLKLISRFTINQLHYQVHKHFVEVLFLRGTLCLEGFRFESEKKNLIKREGQVIVGLKFWTSDVPPRPDSLTPYLWNLLIVHWRFKQSVADVTTVEPFNNSTMLLVVCCRPHQHRTSWKSIVVFDRLLPMSPTSEPPKLRC